MGHKPCSAYIKITEAEKGSETHLKLITSRVKLIFQGLLSLLPEMQTYVLFCMHACELNAVILSASK